MANGPRSREKNVTGKGQQVYRRGEGHGTGPVGNSNGYQGRGGKQSGGGKRSGGFNPITLIILVIALLGGGGGGLSALLGGGDSGNSAPVSPSGYQSTTQSNNTSSQNASQTMASTGNPYGPVSSGSFLGSLLGGEALPASSVSAGWALTSNNGKLDTTVADGARSKRTTILGRKKDTVTIMVYMCGADLESRGGMATADLTEMASADLGSNVNILVFTGGASTWKNSIISNRTTQIYKVEKGGLKRLESDMGNVSMTKPSTLTSFIKYCTKNFPANRNELIFWDHGGGSITGYGHDEKFAGQGSMTLQGIDEALRAAGTTFDFIGFDACLMATVENGLMLNSYADYLIASEETEPGVGWYYTNWLSRLSADPSLPTLEIGKNIADDFVTVCGQKCQGQKTTLSVIDLAELSATVPSALAAFSDSTTGLMQNNAFGTVSRARAGAREFAVGTNIDQVDFVDMVSKVGTSEGTALAKSLLGAVKYNRTSSNMTNAYGLSIYFPYKKMSSVHTALLTYDAINMDASYANCIRKFASLSAGGQAVAGGSSSPYASLSGSSQGSSQSSSASPYESTDLIYSLLESLMSGSSTGNIGGLSSSNSGWMGRSLDPDTDTEYLFENRFLEDQLVWTDDPDGKPALYLPEDQWELVNDLKLNLFVDDGEGYIDMGLDTVYSFTGDGGLCGDYDGTWLAINDHPVAYYHTGTIDDGENYTITGYVPAYLNGERIKLILVFDNDHPYGYIAGAELVYDTEVTETLSKNLLELEEGDVLDFIADYYSYDNEYLDNYSIGEALIVEGDLVISDVELDDNELSAVYRFTDIYGQDYWTPVMNR